MPSIRVRASTLSGQIKAPPSKSHTLRAILFASLAQGQSRIDNCLCSPDTLAMVAACRQFGATITEQGETLLVDGVAGRLQVAPDSIIDAGNSGQVLRYVAAVMATQSQSVTITGDESICTSRPVRPYIDAFPQLHSTCVSLSGNGYAPLQIQGPFEGNTIRVDGTDSQIVTGLCIAAVLRQGDTVIEVDNAGEKPWIDLTVNWLQRLGVSVQRQGYELFRITGCMLSAFNYTVPGDFSSAAFPCAAALVTQSPLLIEGVDWDDTQGDKALFYALKRMGACLEMHHDNRTLSVDPSVWSLSDALDINDYIDAITILAVLGCYASSPLRITGAAIAREKESDRIEAICAELSKMGARIEATADGLVVQPSSLRGAHVRSHHDHRIAMSLAVAALAAEGDTVIEDVACIQKSYPQFTPQFQALGADIEVL